ncbi:non-ribosomal peptide synthase/polyketide synthase [Pseudomonas akapageensis]|uniref:non-ribosomal peptide synthase/polyketide synthase n=1 Tax=Pseudomonas akapageensis TaxID=2609961 RepID=UPI00140C7BBC|nr:non-ribosomal peptide synthase/polyketide synthase [Pseudomonas akapageensis]
MSVQIPADSTFVERLQRLAERQPTRTALRLLVDGDDNWQTCSFAQLDVRARTVGAALQGSAGAGERAVLLFPSGLDYVAAFFGCLYAGCVAVPAYPPESLKPQHLERLLAIISDAEPRFILTDSALLPGLQALQRDQPALAGLELIAVDVLDPALAGLWQRPGIRPEDLAFLQYTSGSTSTPKGVMVGHDNLIANERAIRSGFGIHDSDVIVSWLPLYHDMGLIGSLLQGIYSGIEVVLMSPRHFLERPLRWLDAVSRFGGSVSGGPDFAFRLCTERVRDSALAGLDLSGWRLAFSGSEPVRHDTLQAFCDKFVPYGFDPQALFPCYGLAEATLFVSAGVRGAGLRAENFVRDDLAQGRAVAAEQGDCLIGCGGPVAEHEVRIAAPGSLAALADGQVGEICFAGPSVTHGYWRNPEATAAAFVADGGQTFLRTGDLGFVHDGTLFISGRSKDLIIIRGHNIYPQDIEKNLEDEIDLLRKGRVAAFPVQIDGRESIGVAVEVSRSVQKLVPPSALFASIRECVALAHQEPASVILLLQPGTLPKTTSGKVQRSTCRRLWESGSDDIYASFPADLEPQASTEPASALSPREAQVAALWQDLLKVERVLPDDSFFALGGTSILAMQGLARLQDELGIQLEPRLLFEAPTLRGFAAVLETAQASGRPALQAISRLPRSGELPLSLGQRRLWFLAQLEPNSSAYHIAATLHLRGALNPVAVQQAFARLFARHESLRSEFPQRDGQPWLRLLPSDALQVTFSQWPGDSLEQLRERADQAMREPFDLQQGPLIRVQVLQRGADEALLLVNLHHIIADGSSMQVLIDEFAQLYTHACVGGDPLTLPALPVGYVDFAEWQRLRLERDDEQQRQLAYWVARLGGEQPVLELPTDSVAKQPRLQAASFSVSVPAVLTAQLRALALAEGSTLFMLLLTSFQALLQRLSGQRDIRLGVPVANRPRQELQGVVGFFVNTLVLRAEVDPQQSFAALLRQSRSEVLDAQAHQDLPFEQLVDTLAPERSLGHNPLFQVAFNHQQQDRSALQSLPGLQLLGLQRLLGDAQFDLSLDSEEQADGSLALTFTYACERFDERNVARIAERLSALLAQLPEQAFRPLAELDLLSADEQQQLHAWSQPVGVTPSRPLVHDAISEQAALRPDAIALVCGDRSLTFAELESRANQLAHRLIALGVGRETLVGVALDRSLELILAPLAIIKAGGAYVPLDPEYPAERLAYMVNDSGLQLVLTDSSLALEWPEGVQALSLDQLDISGESPVVPAVAIDPQQLAYMIYTSGSTGQPKGVTVEHGPLSMHCRAAAELYDMSADDIALHFASISFDGAVEQWLSPMMFGARLVMRGPGLISAEQSYQTLVDEQVSIAYFPTSYAHQLAEWALAHPQDLALRSCTIGGEAVSRETFELLRRGLKAQRIINGYGPTETIVTPTLWRADGDVACETPYAPIGHAVGNRTLYVLDADLNLLPPGMAGELYIGGEGLARGYHQRPDLTAERFVPDPFSATGGRLYRSGDRVRWLADGSLEYLGRIDQQVKVRGYRIELGEIEARLQAHTDVGEAVVVLRDKRLVGYVVSSRDDSLAEELKAQLKDALPDYMVPSKILVLERFPLTPNGKVDRKALPEPVWESQSYQAPTTPEEQALAAIWQQVLGLEQVGLHDNFFELGGDSIVSIQVVSRARQAGLALTPKDLFQHQTLQALARVAKPVEGQLAIDQGPVSGALPLTPIQAWFFEQPIPQRHHWNQSILLKAAQPLDSQALNCALQMLVSHHDALRLSWQQEGERWTQRHRDIAEQALLWEREATTAAEITAHCDEAQASLDLQDGPLLRAVHIRLADGTARLLLVVHHLVVDGVSWRILLEDLQTAYTGQPLPAKTSAYKHWAEHLQAFAQGEVLQAEVAYWQQQLAGPADQFPEDGTPGAGIESLTLTLDKTRTAQLLKTANAAYRTRIDDLLLTALARTLCRWNGQASVLVDLEGHGREELFADLDLTRTVGWFTSLYPQRLSSVADIGEHLKATKETLRQVPTKGVGFGALRYLAGASQLRELPAAQVTFNYLGQLDSSFDGLFELATESSGQAQSAQAPLSKRLEINAQVHGAELSLSWRFDAAQHSIASVQGLLDHYSQALHEVLEHCLNAEAGGVTPSDFPLAHLSQEQLDSLPPAPREIEDIYPLSPLQQGMLFHALQDSAADAYFYQRGFLIEGTLDQDALVAAWTRVAERYPVLRTAYYWEEAGTPLQVVLRHARIDLQEHDWRGLTLVEQRGRRQALLDSERRAGFDFRRAGEVRLSLLRVATTQWWLIWSNHHIALDGWSMGLILRDVLGHYHGHAVASGAIGSRPYADYIGWLQRQSAEANQAFWRGQLAGWSAPTPLPGRLANAPAQQGYAELTSTFASSDTAHLRAAAQRLGVTINTLLQGAWALLLGHYAQSRDVLFGITVSGRALPLAGVEEMVGLFINTLPLRVELPMEQSVATWLQTLQRTNLDLRTLEHSPLADVQRMARPSDSGESGALFESILVFENYPLDEVLRHQPAGLKLSLLDDQAAEAAARGRNNYPLSLIASLDEQLELTFSFQRGAFTERQIERLLQQLRQVLVAMANQPEQRLQQLPLALSSDAPQALSELHGDTRDFSWATVLDGWVEQLALNPDAPALQDEHQCLSRADVEAAANRLAHALLERGVSPETPVGLCVEPSVDLVIGLLGILKAGAVYVPLDSRQPAERISALLTGSGAPLLLCHAATQSLADACAHPALALHGSELENHEAAAPVLQLSAGQGAYLIYTSGSTGQPKGVLVEHRSLANYVQAVLERLALPAGASMALVSTSAADLGHTQLFGALCSGRLLHVPGQERRFDPDRFADYMARHQVAVLKIVPSHLRGLLHAERAVDVLPSHALIVGGEACDRSLLERIRALRPDCRIINHYGPSETTVGVLTWELPADHATPDRLPLGQPLANVVARVLDAEQQLLPAGQPGELYLGGGCLARGYLGQPEQTAERFMVAPAFPGERLYRTGDRVCLRDGQLEFLGRVDDQVKIRGNRVELGEITACLSELPGVAAAAVRLASLNADEHQQLLGYLVPSAGTTLDLDSLRESLVQRLPDYLVPARLLLLERLPLNANGKLDRHALPPLAAPVEMSAAPNFAAPQGEQEILLAEIWQAVLKCDKVGRDDNFFELGGDSILSLQIIARARKRGLKLTPKQLFATPTIAALAAMQHAQVVTVAPAAPRIPRLPRNGALPLSLAQQRLWFLAQLEPQSSAYTIAGALQLNGDLDRDALRQAFAQLAERHEMLRAAFFAEAGQPRLRIVAGRRPLWHDFDMNDVPAEQRLAAVRQLGADEIARPFDLEHEPLLRVTLMQLEQDKHVLLVCLHHLIADGWSMALLMDELGECYAATKAGRPAQLPALACDYVDYAAWQRNRLEGGELQRQLDYWTAQLEEAGEPLALPYDRARPEQSDGRGASHGFALDSKLLGDLRHTAQASGCTLFHVLLAGFGLLLQRYSGQQDVRIGLPVSGREQGESQGLVGCLINTLVLRLQLAGVQSVGELLGQARDVTLNAQAHADVPFEQLVEKLVSQRTPGTHPLFQVLFNHQRRDISGLAQRSGLGFERLELTERSAQFDLVLDTEEDADGAVQVRLLYAAERFEPATIELLAAHWQQLLKQLVAGSETALGRVQLNSAAELQQLAQWSAVQQSFPDFVPVSTRIATQAALRPDAAAISHQGVSVSYAELEQRANQLAHRLIGLGVGTDVLVGVALPRSPELIVALLAVLKAGGAYVPLDPDYPAERLAYMVEDSGLQQVISLSSLDLQLPVQVLALDTLDLSAEPLSAPGVAIDPEQLAYVIYTSGSTGKPKGAQLTQRNVERLFQATQGDFGFNEDDVWTLFHSYAFDFSVWEIFGALVHGGRLVIVPYFTSRSPEDFLALLAEEGVTVLNQTPSAFRQLTHLAQKNAAELALRYVIFGGEALELEALRPWFERYGDRQPQLINMYGITETTVHVTYREITWQDLAHSGPSPIGRPLADLSLHVLDADLNPQPVGIAGELYVGGAGLARGYLNRPELTSERFIASPFDAQQRLYRSGDLARRTADGGLEYLGRIDQQVKIRGFRIELGEIEAQLQSHPQVSEAAVLVKDGAGGQRLVGYVASADPAIQDSLKAHLHERLPEYMVPAQIVVLATLPLTVNGKLDRRALPEPEAAAGREYRAPQTETEQAVAGIWAELLGAPRVGLDDDFFELGGHSLLATQVISRVQQQLGTQVALRELFEATTLTRFCAQVDASRGQALNADTASRMAALLTDLEID